jgi:hypothetical protein
LWTQCLTIHLLHNASSVQYHAVSAMVQPKFLQALCMLTDLRALQTCRAGAGDRATPRFLFWRRRTSSLEDSDAGSRSPVWARLDAPQQSDLRQASSSSQSALQAMDSFEATEGVAMRAIAASGGAGRAPSMREELLRADATLHVGGTGSSGMSVLHRQGNPKVRPACHESMLTPPAAS